MLLMIVQSKDVAVLNFKIKSFYAKEPKQKRFFRKKIYVSVDLQQRTKRRA